MSIEAVRSALPSIVHTASDIAAQTGGDAAFIRDKVGLHTRYVLGDDETGVSLAEKACNTLLQDSALRPSEVDLLVFVTQNPDRRIPQNSAILAGRLGLSTDLAAFDLSLGCSGYVYGLAVVESFLAATGRNQALLVTCDPYSRIIAREDLSTNTIFGDAATATWISRTGTRTRSGPFDFGTDGESGDAIRVDAGGAAAPLVNDQGGVAQYSRDDLRLRMDGRAVFNFVLGRIPESISGCLKSNDIELGDIDYFAFHQGSEYMLKMLTRKMGIPDQKVLANMADYGNTVSSTIPLLLESLFKREDVSGKKILICGFGVGLSWATTVVHFEGKK